MTRVLVAMSRALEREAYAPFQGTPQWTEGVFTGPPGTRLLPGVWVEAVEALTDFLACACQRRVTLRMQLARLNWDTGQLASVVLPYVLADGGHRVQRMRRLLRDRGELYARNWILQIAQQRAKKAFDALGRRQRTEYLGGLARGSPDRGQREAHEAALIAEELLPRLSTDHRRVLLTYSVHQFADPDARKCRISIRGAADALALETGESWTYHRVRCRHEEMRAWIIEHVDMTDPQQLYYVVSLLTLLVIEEPLRP